MAAAQDKKEKLAEPITKGERVFTCGHSFHVWVPAHRGRSRQEGRHPGARASRPVVDRRLESHSALEHRPRTRTTAKEALKTGKVDVLTLSPIFFPDAGIENFTKLALEHNKDIRILVQPIWLRGTFTSRR